MQPGVVAGGVDGTEVRLVKGAAGDVVDQSIANKKVGDVPVDQVSPSKVAYSMVLMLTVL
jgi:hypothetical protein